MNVRPLLRIDLEHRVNEVPEALRVLRAGMLVLRVHDRHRDRAALLRRLCVLERRVRVREGVQCASQ